MNWTTTQYLSKGFPVNDFLYLRNLISDIQLGGSSPCCTDSLLAKSVKRLNSNTRLVNISTAQTNPADSAKLGHVVLTDTGSCYSTIYMRHVSMILSVYISIIIILEIHLAKGLLCRDSSNEHKTHTQNLNWEWDKHA